MRNERIVEIKGEVERIERKFDTFLKRLGAFEDIEKRAFDISKPIPGTDSSTSDIRARHAAVAGLVRKLDPKTSTIAPLAFFNATTNALRSVGNAFDQIEAELNTIESWNGLNILEYGSFTANCNNGNSRDLSAPFKTLFDSSESFLSSFFQIFNSVNPSRAAFNFGSAAKTLRNSINQNSLMHEILKKRLAESEAALARFQEEEAKILGILAKVDKSASAVTDIQSRSSEAMGEITAVIERIREANSEASAMQASVKEYSENFLLFDEQLSAREKKFTKGSDELDRLISTFSEQETYISGIIDQSDNMLSGATVAGLSSEFKNIRDDLTIQVDDARKTFNWAIAFLFASAIPLIVFIFAPIFGPIFYDDDRILASIASVGNEKSGWQYVGQVIARFIILLPAIWFVTFATGRYNSLFKLREHYSYKYSMAVAVEGFKKQAPGHEDMIAALVFEQLAFNPADKMGKQPEGPETPPSPIAKLLVETLRRDKSTDDS